MKEFLSHLFIPRRSNGHRSRALHFSSLFFYAILLCFIHVGLNSISHHSGLILGYASNISVTDLLTDTNLKRKENGLDPLVLNSQLSQAANAKAQNMFAEQYWAHVSPTGKDPWSFIHQFGYSYLYAGENLARDFGDSKSVVDAWMNSPSHRENLLNSHFKEIGFAVVNGKYGDYETTLVVQMFGAKSAAVPTVKTDQVQAVANVPEAVTPIVNTILPAQPQDITSQSKVSGADQVVTAVSKPSSSSLSIFNITKIIFGVMGIFLLVLLILDSLVVFRNKTFRVASHNGAHFLILIGTVITIVLLDSGLII